MKHTALAKKNQNARGTSTRSRRATATDRQFAACVDNNGYEASPERNKIYVVVSEDMARAIEWAKKCPNPMPGQSEIEIRPFYEMTDFGGHLTPEAAAIHQRNRDIVTAW